MTQDIRIGGTTLVPTYARAAVLDEMAAGGRAEVHEYAYQDGGQAASLWYTKPVLTVLRTVPAGVSPAEIAQAYHALSGLLLGGPKTLRKTDPHAGTLETSIGVIDRSGRGSDRLEWTWPTWILPGHFWSTTDITDSETGLGASGTVGMYTPGGTHPTAPIFTITCTSAGDNPSITVGSQTLTATGSFSNSDVIVIDVPARTVTVNTVRAKNLLNYTHAHWMRWTNGVAQTVGFTSDSGTWTVDVSYKNRWRV